MTTRITGDNIANGSITSEKIVGLPPKISSIDYPGDDTAASPSGGQTITINGSGFSNSSIVYIDGTQVSVVSYIDSETLSFVSPAKPASNYALYLINADGGTAISIPGISYSNSPVWSTASGSLGSPFETQSFGVGLSATGDGSVTYAVSSGNSLPSGLTLTSNGYLSGTIPATDPTTTYTFYVDAIDSQNQETSRSFSVTYNKDAVTWSSPANGAAYSLATGVANTVSLIANSAAGKSITYTIQSGSLPANVSISGANVSGTPNTGQTNTLVVIRATATDTNRFADRTLWFTVISDTPYSLVSSTGSPAPLLESNSSISISWPGGFFVSPDGTRFYNLFGDGSLGYYVLSPAYSISTPAFQGTMAVPSGYTDVFFDSSGTKMFISNYQTDTIRRYNLSEAWNIFSASISTSFSVASQQGVVTGIDFSTDGTKMFIIGNAGGNKSIHSYTLSTAWDITTASLWQSMGVPDANNAWKIRFSSDGTRMFVALETSSGSSLIRYYSLSTPWTIGVNGASATLVTSLDTYSYGQSGGKTGVVFSGDGAELYIGVTNAIWRLDSQLP